MKTASSHFRFADILVYLAKQDPEEKLRIAFDLNNFVKKLHKAGADYAKNISRQRTRATA